MWGLITIFKFVPIALFIRVYLYNHYTPSRGLTWELIKIGQVSSGHFWSIYVAKDRKLAGIKNNQDPYSPLMTGELRDISDSESIPDM